MFKLPRWLILFRLSKLLAELLVHYPPPPWSKVDAPSSLLHTPKALCICLCLVLYVSCDICRYFHLK